MKIKVQLTVIREVEVKPDYYKDKQIPDFATVQEEWIESVQDDPFAFIDNRDVTPGENLLVTVEEIPL